MLSEIDDDDDGSSFPDLSQPSIITSHVADTVGSGEHTALPAVPQVCLAFL